MKRQARGSDQKVNSEGLLGQVLSGLSQMTAYSLYIALLVTIDLCALVKSQCTIKGIAFSFGSPLSTPFEVKLNGCNNCFGITDVLQLDIKRNTAQIERHGKMIRAKTECRVRLLCQSACYQYQKTELFSLRAQLDRLAPETIILMNASGVRVIQLFNLINKLY